MQNCLMIGFHKASAYVWKISFGKDEHIMNAVNAKAHTILWMEQ